MVNLWFADSGSNWNFEILGKTGGGGDWGRGGDGDRGRVQGWKMAKNISPLFLCIFNVYQQKSECEIVHASTFIYLFIYLL